MIIRSREGPDGATPSGNAVAASGLARLAAHWDRNDWREQATSAIRAYGRQIARYPRAFAKSLAVVDFLTSAPVELAFLEIMQPALADCVGRLAQGGHGRIVIAPLFLAQGGHLKKDLPRLLGELEARHPAADISVLPPIGEVTELLDAISEWLVNSAPR